MTLREFDLLERLKINGPQTPGELAAYGRLPWDSHQLITANLQRLEGRGLVLRAADGIWRATPKAKAVLAV